MTRTIYLHGFASSPASRKARFFQERFAEIGEPLTVLDLAEEGFEKLTISGQLGVLERTAQEEPVNLIGSSLGGYLAAAFAARNPEVKKLVLLAPAFQFMTNWAEQLGGDAMREWKTTGVLPVHHYAMNDTANLGYGFAKDAAGFEDFPNFPQPALIFHGREDNTVPPEVSVTFAQQHERVRLHLVDSGHELTDVLDFIWAETLPFLREDES